MSPSSERLAPRVPRAGTFGFAVFAAVALTALPAVARAAKISVVDSEPLRAIAVAEDERRFSPEGLGAFLSHRDAAVRARAVLAVGRLQDSTSVPALKPLLADSSMEVRRQAVFALGQIGHRSARAALDPLVFATDPELRRLTLEPWASSAIARPPHVWSAAWTIMSPRCARPPRSRCGGSRIPSPWTR